MTAPERPLRVLVLSWNYPTPAAPQRGLWVERMCDAAASRAEVTVIVPTPWVPPLVPMEAIARFRRVPVRERRGKVTIEYPRVPGSIEYLTHGFDARLALPRLRALARRLHRDRPFDLIHAHFIYPDGVVASHIGRDLGIPVMTSEHAFWTPWLVTQRRVGAQVAAALPGISLVTAVSEFLRQSIEAYAGSRIATAVLPNVVDDATFTPAPRPRDLNELVFVGLIRKAKGVAVLLRALAEVRVTRPDVHLKILSARAFRAYASDRREIQTLIATLGLEHAVRVVNGADPPAVAEAMRRCGFVVVSSNRETFCSVAAESLACGTPLVVTRCGGPEEFVTPNDGVMVDPDDPKALAAGILRAFEMRATFRPDQMHARIVGRFGRAAWGDRALAIYTRIAAGQVTQTRATG